MRALWHKVINGKYGDDVEGWRSCKVSEEDEVGLWKTIRKGWDILGSRVAFSMGNGRKVRFG